MALQVGNVFMFVPHGHSHRQSGIPVTDLDAKLMDAPTNEQGKLMFIEMLHLYSDFIYFRLIKT